MSRRLTLRIENIWAGHQPSQFFKAPGQYLDAIGIDPDLPLTDAVGDRKASGLIRPSAYGAMSLSNMNDEAVAIIATPQQNSVYIILRNGKIISLSSVWTETLAGTVAGGNAEGAFLHDNYIYITGTGSNKDNVSRYGPLSGSPAVDDDVWVTDWGLTNLDDPDMPKYRGGSRLPAHWGTSHVGGKAYFVDFDVDSGVDIRQGKGLVHKIHTKKTTNQGDTDAASAFNVLDLPPNYLPTCIVEYGTDIVIGAVNALQDNFGPSRASLFFWDTLNPLSFYQKIDLPDPLVTALKVNNGILYAFTGPLSTGSDVANGYRVSAYAGGLTMQELYYSEDGVPPLPGAVDAFGGRLLWGTIKQLRTTTAASPEYYAVVMALNSKKGNLPQGVHCIAKATATGTAADGMVTAIKVVQHDSFAHPKVLIAHRDADGYGIDKAGTTYGVNVFRDGFNIGRPFTIRRIRIPLALAVAANMTITPTVFLDGFSSSSTNGLTVINSTNYSDSERWVEYTPEIHGKNDFVLELRGSGSALAVIGFPIEIDIDIEDN